MVSSALRPVAAREASTNPEHDLCFMPATALAAAIRTKKLSPVEVVNAVYARQPQPTRV
jgi:hypothetical protein